MDNGYDAWVPDNNEDLTTYSDKPGKDRQQTTGASLKSTWGLGASGAELVDDYRVFAQRIGAQLRRRLGQR